MTATHADRLRAANARILVEGDLDAIPGYFAPDFVVHATEHDLTGGHAALRRFVEAVRRAFPEPTAVVEILVEGTDRVAWQRTVRATHRAPYLGFPATGRTIVWRDMVVSRFRDGLVAEDWVITDLAERLLRARKA